nr:hypothetical protein [Tanacetum cinerariifolium]
EDLFTYCIENGVLQYSSKPSNDNTNVVNALQELFIVKQDPRCGDSLKDIFFHQCTCELYGNDAHYGYYCPPKIPFVPDPKPVNNQTVDELPQTLPSFEPTGYSEDGNSFTYDPKSNLVHDSTNVFDPPLQTPLNRVTIKTLISRRIFNNNIFVVKITGILIKLTNIDSLFDEFAGELTLLKSIPLGINETDCDCEEEIRLINRLLYDNSSPRPLEEFISENSNTAFESFSPFLIPVEDSNSF